MTIVDGECCVCNGVSVVSKSVRPTRGADRTAKFREIRIKMPFCSQKTGYCDRQMDVGLVSKNPSSRPAKVWHRGRTYRTFSFFLNRGMTRGRGKLMLLAHAHKRIPPGRRYNFHGSCEHFPCVHCTYV